MSKTELFSPVPNESVFTGFTVQKSLEENVLRIKNIMNGEYLGVIQRAKFFVY